MVNLLDLFSKRRQAGATRTANILTVERAPAVVYAIGDIHGCLAQLRELESMIVADAENVAGEKWIVCLGDYTDRGPQSSQVIDHLIAPPPAGFHRITLRGNHDAMMLEAIEDPRRLNGWLSVGGDATLQSYGIDLSATRRGISRDVLRANIPDEHVRFLSSLTTALVMPGYVFVHAGLRPGIALDQQVEDDMLWIREEFYDAGHDFGVMVVHGHSITPDPQLLKYRTGIDTGCFMSGRLTAARIDAVGITVLQTGNR